MRTPDPAGEPDDACQDDLTPHAEPFPAQELIDAAVLHLAAASGDAPVLDRMAAVQAARQLLVEAELQLGFRARAEGYSWQAVAEATGRKKQSAQEYWRKAEKARELVVDGAAAEPAEPRVATTSRNRAGDPAVTTETVTVSLSRLPWASVTLLVGRARRRG